MAQRSRSEFDPVKVGWLGACLDGEGGGYDKIHRMAFDEALEQGVLPRKVEHVIHAENGLPNVDQVVVWVDHYGLFDGEYRTFQNVNVRRRWVLQRLDEGPWKITSIQGL